ncbi:uncharacterized protein LOC105386934 [Plutella xylostella]|uniref:uncharacterized protein LOC105386934 n=1 Tax=Plutella xylostella TaxID=51655 RepID=UPI0020324D64|nr:uncharacterized protein LOC105386934 [Plutella xylostella]
MGRANRIDPTTDPKVYIEISGKYTQFLDNCNVPAKPVVRVFDPLSKRHLDALELSREVTRELIKKKEDDMTKAKQQAEEDEAEAEAEKEDAAKTEGQTEEQKQ